MMPDDTKYDVCLHLELKYVELLTGMLARGMTVHNVYLTDLNNRPLTDTIEIYISPVDINGPNEHLLCEIAEPGLGSGSDRD